VLIAVVVSLLVLMYQANHAPVVLLRRDPKTGRWRARGETDQMETLAGLAVVRTEGRLYFANAQRVSDHVIALVDGLSPPPRVVVFDASLIPDLETTALTVLVGLQQELKTRGATLWLAGLRQVPGEMVQRALAHYEGRSVPLFDDVEAAVAAFEKDAA
jgi:MFS superfamily sulfate permease-like transporter